jgi:hypothetical protein
MVNAKLTSNVASTVIAPVVDDQDLDARDPVNAARQVSHRLPEMLTLVVTGDLNDEA